MALRALLPDSVSQSVLPLRILAMSLSARVISMSSGYDVRVGYCCANASAASFAVAYVIVFLLSFGVVFGVDGSEVRVLQLPSLGRILGSVSVAC